MRSDWNFSRQFYLAMLHLHVHCKFGTETLCNTLHIHIFCMNIVCMLMRFECQHTVASTCEDDAIEYYYHIEETTVDSAHSHTRTTHTHTHNMNVKKKKKVNATSEYIDIASRHNAIRKSLYYFQRFIRLFLLFYHYHTFDASLQQQRKNLSKTIFLSFCLSTIILQF